MLIARARERERGVRELSVVAIVVVLVLRAFCRNYNESPAGGEDVGLGRLRAGQDRCVESKRGEQQKAMNTNAESDAEASSGRPSVPKVLPATNTFVSQYKLKRTHAHIPHLAVSHLLHQTPLCHAPPPPRQSQKQGLRADIPQVRGRLVRVFLGHDADHCVPRDLRDSGGRQGRGGPASEGLLGFCRCGGVEAL